MLNQSMSKIQQVVKHVVIAFSKHFATRLCFVICYASQLYDKQQRNHNVTKKELLAFIIFAKKFCQYMLGNQFLVRTDYTELQ